MRRRPGHPESARPEETERALALLSLEAATAGVASAAVESASSALARAAEDAFEAAFADGEEDRSLYASSAMDGLVARDRIASLQCAATRRLEIARRAGPQGSSDVGALEAAITELAARVAVADGGAAAWGRSLTGVNAQRRVAFEALSPAAQAGAWWYGARLEDDGLLGALSGSGGGVLSESGRAEVQKSGLPGRDGLTSHALAALSHGAPSPAVRAHLERTAERDLDVKRGVELALDRSIEEDAVTS